MALHEAGEADGLAQVVGAGTIVAAITPAASGVRAIVRLSGDAAHASVDALLVHEPRTAAPAATARVARVSPARLQLAPGMVLPVLVTRWFGPRSFTGEDCVEVQFPGAPVLTRLVLALLARQPGVRLAGPGEFSARAFLNGRLTPDEADGIAALIRATTDDELAAARELARGLYGERFADLASELATLLALVEAGADFTDQEDVVPIAAGMLHARLERAIERCRRLVGEAGLVRSSLPRVLLVGAPNAGKSTIFNAMVGRGRAVASPLRGSTRDVLVETVDLSRVGSDSSTTGSVIELCDLPGLESLESAPESSASRAAQAAAREAINGAQLLVWCDPGGTFDTAWLQAHARVPGESDNREAAAHGGVSVLRVRTFADRVSASRPASQGTSADLAVCGLVASDASRLARAIAQRLSRTDCSAQGGVAGQATPGAFSAVLPRHRDAIARVASHLAAGVAELSRSADRDAPPTELVAQELRASLDAAAELVGRIDPDDILGRIFATFCVGK